MLGITHFSATTFALWNINMSVYNNNHLLLLLNCGFSPFFSLTLSFSVCLGLSLYLSLFLLSMAASTFKDFDLASTQQRPDSVLRRRRRQKQAALESSAANASSGRGPTFSGTAARSTGRHGSHGGFRGGGSRCGQHRPGVGPQTGLVSLNCSSFYPQPYVSLTESSRWVCIPKNPLINETTNTQSTTLSGVFSPNWTS